MRLKVERDIEHFHHLLLHCFDSKKTTIEVHRLILETYFESAPSVKICEYWFTTGEYHNSKDNFNLKDKERSGQSKKFEDVELQAL